MANLQCALLQRVVDMGFWLIDLTAGSALLLVVAILSLFGFMEHIQVIVALMKGGRKSPLFYS